MLAKAFNSFYGPELSLLGEGESHFLTLTHWIEARKFDIHKHEQLVLEILAMPNEYQARRLSAQNKSEWRSDWGMVKAKVMAQGVAYYCLSRQNQNLFMHRLVQEMQRCGVSEAVATVHSQKGLSLAMGKRVCVLAEPSVPAAHLSRRLRLINKRFNNEWILMHWRGRNSNVAIHDWAISSGLPVLYAGTKDQRTVSIEFSGSADVFYVFDRKGDKRSEKAVSNLKLLGKDVEVILWEPDQIDDLFG